MKIFATFRRPDSYLQYTFIEKDTQLGRFGMNNKIAETDTEEDENLTNSFSLEQSDDSIDYKEIKERVKMESGVVVVLGNEVDGVSDYILKESDLAAEIPMIGQKESLNVSVSAGIFLFSIFDN